MSIRPRNGPCGRFCASACSTSGTAASCSPASSPINWLTTGPPAARTFTTASPGPNNSSPSEPDPVRRLALQNDLALVGHYDNQLASLEKELLKLTKQTASCDFTLLQTTPGIGDYLGLTLLHEIGDMARFPHRQRFPFLLPAGQGHSRQCRQDQGVAGSQTRQPYLRWAFGEAAVVAKRDGVLGPLTQRLEARMGGNKFKANAVLAIKLARAIYFMLKNKTAFDADRLVAALRPNLDLALTSVNRTS